MRITPLKALVLTHALRQCRTTDREAGIARVADVLGRDVLLLRAQRGYVVDRFEVRPAPGDLRLHVRRTTGELYVGREPTSELIV